MKLDTDRIDQAVLALPASGASDGTRAWKSLDWDAMARLHEGLHLRSSGKRQSPSRSPMKVFVSRSSCSKPYSLNQTNERMNPFVAHCYEAMRGWAAMHNGALAPCLLESDCHALHRNPLSPSLVLRLFWR